MGEWKSVEERPEDGESIWMVIREWDGKHRHVDYGVAFIDTDGLIVHRCETGDYVQWPPSDCEAWMPCEVPEVPA